MYASSRGQWIRTRKRWAIYLRDKLTCVYCMTKVTDLHKNRRFLTLDHVKDRDDHTATNLVTACSRCNSAKRGQTLAWTAGWLGQNASTLRGRIKVRKDRDFTQYLSGARALLGEVPGVPIASVVRRNSELVKATRATFALPEVRYAAGVGTTPSRADLVVEFHGFEQTFGDDDGNAWDPHTEMMMRGAM